MARKRAAIAVLGSLALLVTACGDDDDTSGDDATTTTAVDDGETTTTAGGDGGGEALTITTVDYAFEGLPAELPGGVLEFTLANEGEAQHEIAFVELGPDTELEQFFTDFGPVIEEGAPFPEYAESIVAANEAAPGESASFAYTLPEGRYVAFCALTGTPEDPEGEDGAPHFTMGMQQEVNVGPAEGEAALPEADGTITASDYTFAAEIPAGATVINFVNDGPDQVHFAGIDGPFPEGTTPEDAEAAFATLIQLEDDEAPPEGTPTAEEFAFSGVASAGNAIQFPAPSAFAPGTYIAYCFIQDRAGGPPHAIAYQMYKAFTVE